MDSRAAALLALWCAGGCASKEAGLAGPPSYERLSETGLYADLAERRVSDAALGFSPTFALWSDGAGKSRWLNLPSGASIDTSDPDHWAFPIGTRVWKEFSLQGRPLETRLIERYGPEPDDYWMGAFVWEADGSDAVLTEDGMSDVLDTEHDVPAREQCPSCHNGEAGRILGLSALQLSEPAPAAGGLTLGSLAEAGLLSDALPAGERYLPPGDAVASAALGYLHANCGHCHNPRGTAWPDTQMLLRLDLGECTPSSAAEASGVFESVVGRMLQYFRPEEQQVSLRVAPGLPDESGVLTRMEVRGPMEQMPPLATEQVDPAGTDAMRRWIAGLAR